MMFSETSLTSEEFESMVEWLRHNVAPLSQVRTFMEKTAVKRAELIRSLDDGTSHNNIVTDYPRLFDMPGMVSIFWRAVLC